MDTATSGEVWIDGKNIVKYSPRQLTSYRRDDIGFVFQFYNLIPNLTALENVELALQICKDPLDAEMVLREVGLADRMKNFPAQLSGGEQQRVSIARALADPNSTPQTFGRPGHINPLYAQDNGVLRRSGHTEAAIDLCKMAGLYPAGALMEIMNEDGTMARLPELMKMAKEWNLKVISIKDMIEYRLKKESLIEVGEEVDMPTEYGHFRLIPFRQSSNGLEHMALIKGEWKEDEPILVRVHSSCATGDILGSKRCDCGQQLHKAMQMIDEAGKGVVVYMQQEGRGIGLMNKIAAYKLQEEGYDTVDANTHLGFKPDERDYGCGAQMLRHLGVHKMRLLTNNPVKRVGLEAYGLEIVENVPIEVVPNKYNERYLKTKRDRMGHTLHLG